jgi:beta-mannosidase
MQYNLVPTTSLSCFVINVNFETLEKFMPQEAFQRFENTKAWRDHFAFEEEGRVHGHCDYNSVSRYFGEVTDVKQYIKYSQFLACAGYTYIFEEGRRQPMCSMVMNWCFNEPWYCAANNSLVGYGNIKKPTYEAVKKALEPITVSLRMKRFGYHKGDQFEGEIHVLNDTAQNSGIEQIEVYIDNGLKKKLCSMSATSSSSNEYCGNISFTLDSELLGEGRDNKIISIILKAGNIEKCYPIFVWND